MSDTTLSQRNCRTRSRRSLAGRRGVTGILSMMFLVMFSSLALAMAIVSQGNLRTAETNLHVVRATGGIDTGLELAASRLAEAASRFVVAKGEITPEYALDLWLGTFPSDPVVYIAPPKYGREESTDATSIAEALEYHFDSDDSSNIVSSITIPTPPDGWVASPVIGLHKNSDGDITSGVQITYAPPDSLGRVLAIVTGYDYDYTRGRWITRTAQQYFRLTKTVRHAVLGSSRIMIGQNVQVTGPIGVRYDSDALDSIDGPPLVVRSDFYGLDPQLDAKLDDFFNAVLADDIDGDNRLRLRHAIENQNIGALNLEDYDGDASGDYAFEDQTKDEAVDDFDVFLRHYDTNGDGRLVLTADLIAGTVNETATPEFTINPRLGELIDSGNPDRNNNGIHNGDFVDGAWDYDTFKDNNGDGLLNIEDVDPDDVVLGYRDGVLDYKDRYAKVRGSIYFKAERSAWESSEWEDVTVGDYQQYVQGAIRPPANEPPIVFEATNEELPPISPSSFADATQALIDIAGPVADFQQQVIAQTGGGPQPTIVEGTPFGSPAPTDFYERPVYEGLVFKNVTIPMGTNALFIDCTFVGVTRVESYTDNTHPSWQFYGQQMRSPVTGDLQWLFPPPPAESDAQLDKGYSSPGAPGYDALPDPLVVSIDIDGDGSANDVCTNTKLISNNIRFHDCLFVGSIVADSPTYFQQTRNKLQFTGATRFVNEHPDSPTDPSLNPDDEDLDAISKSSMMLPNYSVDIGTNNSPDEQDVNLRGAIIAGLIDVRGNARIDGVLLTTFSPTYGTPPLALYGESVGDPADFNITLGYFGPEDGDFEGLDLSEMVDLDSNGSLDIGWDSARDSDGSLIEVAGWDGTYDESWFDGIPDDDADIEPGTYVKRAIPFNGRGRIILNWDPDVVLPDGLAAPMTITPLRNTYEEGKFDQG